MKKDLLFITKILVIFVAFVLVISAGSVYADDENLPTDISSDNPAEVPSTPSEPDAPSAPDAPEGGDSGDAGDQSGDQSQDDETGQTEEGTGDETKGTDTETGDEEKGDAGTGDTEGGEEGSGDETGNENGDEEGGEPTEEGGLLLRSAFSAPTTLVVEPPKPAGEGVLKVCKIIVDDEGEIITGKGVDAEFSIEITGPDDFYEEVTFNTELSLTDDLVDDNGKELDAQCIELKDLASGSYLYSEESIDEGRGEWGIPLYHDYYKETPQSVEDFYELTVDGSKNDNDEADGSLSVTATNNRKVVVINRLLDIPNPENSCLIPDADGDEDDDDLNGIGEKDLQDVLDSLYGWLDKNDDQLQIQKWDCDADELVLNVKFIDAWAGNKAVFGYYTDSDLGTFSPIFRTGNVDALDNTVDLASAGEEFEVIAGEIDSLGFAIKSWTGSLYNTFTTENSLNPEGADKVVAYNPEEDTYLLAFDDLLKSHIDHNDMVVEIEAVCRDIEEKDPYGIITYPVSDGDVESGMTTLMAEYYDGDDVNDDNVQWAVRAGTCDAGVGTVLGNVDGHSDVATWDGQDFSFEFDADSLEPGDYCFVFNPTDDGPVDVRETRWFVIEDGGNPTNPIYGCTDPSANNYDEKADTDDKSCTYDTTRTTSGGGRRSSSFGGEVLGATTDLSCGMYLFDYMNQDTENSYEEVLKLQAFLLTRGYEVSLTGIFDEATDRAVRDFQASLSDGILVPWVQYGFGDGETPTGYVYKTTRYTINNLVCPGSEAFPVLP